MIGATLAGVGKRTLCMRVRQPEHVTQPCLGIAVIFLSEKRGVVLQFVFNVVPGASRHLNLNDQFQIGELTL